MMGLRTLLLPASPRRLRHRRALRTALRSVHILAVGIYVGGVVFAVAATALVPWLVIAIATGVSLLALELHESCAVLAEARGLATLVKLALLALAHAQPAWAPLLLGVAVLLASVASHMPGEWRHWRPFAPRR